jgi:hypothetical protein
MSFSLVSEFLAWHKKAAHGRGDGPAAMNVDLDASSAAVGSTI